MNAYIKARVPEYLRRFPSVKNLHLAPSPNPRKRLRATFDQDGHQRTIDFGQRGAKTFADGATEKKKDGYKARASKITNADGELTYRHPGTANSLSYWLLW